jgi:hypothetical protein
VCVCVCIVLCPYIHMCESYFLRGKLRRSVYMYILYVCVHPTQPMFCSGRALSV